MLGTNYSSDKVGFTLNNFDNDISDKDIYYEEDGYEDDIDDKSYSDEIDTDEYIDPDEYINDEVFIEDADYDTSSYDEDDNDDEDDDYDEYDDEDDEDDGYDEEDNDDEDDGGISDELVSDESDSNESASVESPLSETSFSERGNSEPTDYTDVDIPKVLGDDSEGLNSALRIKSKITVVLETIDIEDIVTSNFKKVSREKTLVGLSGVVGEWGVVTPVHCLRLEDDSCYMLYDGLRRVFGALRNGLKKINAMVWTFSDPQEGKELANLITLMLNRSQRFTSKEQWEQMQILEEVNGASPGLIEYLLQMDAGEAMKLKDVMLSDVEYSDIRNDLIDGILTIEGAYKKLCTARKKENRLAKEDAMILEGNNEPINFDEVSEEQHLSVDDVKDLLDLTSSEVEEEMTLDELQEAGKARKGEYVQDPDNRHPLDPALRQAVFVRDNFSCRCCGLGGKQRLSVLAAHHVIEVSQGGPDSEDNLITVCVSCHILIHTASWGKVHLTIDDLDENEKETFKKIIKYANIIIEADKRIGRSVEQSMKDGRGNVRHPFPGEGLSENKKAFAAAEREKSKDESSVD